jgi:hypothetical protein
MLNFSSDQWIIVMLVFVLGLLVGGFLFSGGGRKWKQRYNAEVDRRSELERTHATREKEWREQDALRAAALKNNARTTDPRDTNNDGVVTPAEKPGIMDRMLGRDRDGDGVPDRQEADFIDRDGDGVDDRDRK